MESQWENLDPGYILTKALKKHFIFLYPGNLVDIYYAASYFLASNQQISRPF